MFRFHVELMKDPPQRLWHSGRTYALRIAMTQLPLHDSEWCSFFEKLTCCRVTEAARSGSIDVLQLLLDRHAKVDFQDKEGRTALVWAATKGDWPKVVTALVKAGAQVGLKDLTGNTALSRANLLGHRKTVKILDQSSE